jgi:hypothetical protein
VVHQFLRGVGGDLLQFNNIAAVDVRTVGGNTQFRLGDGVTGNGGFANGSLLLTLNGVTGFTSSNINDNIYSRCAYFLFDFHLNFLLFTLVVQILAVFLKKVRTFWTLDY